MTYSTLSKRFVRLFGKVYTIIGLRGTGDDCVLFLRRDHIEYSLDARGVFIRTGYARY